MVLKKRLVYIVSKIDKALEFEDVAARLQDQYELSFILLNTGHSLLEDFLCRNGVTVNRIYLSGKGEYPWAFIKVFFYLLKLKPHIVHTHLIDANIIGLSAAFLARIKKRVYTRHHSSLHHIYFKAGKKFDKFCNYLATDIVSISPTVTDILKNWENVSGPKITYIPHSIDPEKFEAVSPERIHLLKKKYQIDHSPYIVGVVSRLTEWKGVHYIIPAFADFLKIHSNSILVLANASGDIEKSIFELLNIYLDKSQYRTIIFESDNFALFKMFNVFVHVPIDNHSEAFGQVYLEALASRTPLICTLSGIANQIINHRGNAIVVPYENSAKIGESLGEVFHNPTLVKRMVQNGLETIKPYTLNSKVELLKKLYER